MHETVTESQQNVATNAYIARDNAVHVWASACNGLVMRQSHYWEHDGLQLRRMSYKVNKMHNECGTQQDKYDNMQMRTMSLNLVDEFFRVNFVNDKSLQSRSQHRQTALELEAASFDSQDPQLLATECNVREIALRQIVGDTERAEAAGQNLEQITELDKRWMNFRYIQIPQLRATYKYIRWVKG